MNGENTPCMPSLVPVVQLAHPGKLLGKIVDSNGALVPSRMSRVRTGSLPALERGSMMSNVAPSSPIITVFIGKAVSLVEVKLHLKSHPTLNRLPVLACRLEPHLPNSFDRLLVQSVRKMLNHSYILHSPSNIDQGAHSDKSVDMVAPRLLCVARSWLVYRYRPFVDV